MGDTVLITVTLSSEEAAKLIRIAEAQFRHPREQARMIISRSLDVDRIGDDSESASNGDTASASN